MAGEAQRALVIPELLEAILLELPPQSVLLSQRVNTTFKACIDGSLNLQQHLFFRQAPLRTNGQVRLNPMIHIALERQGLRCNIKFYPSRVPSSATLKGLSEVVDAPADADIYFYVLLRSDNVDIVPQSGSFRRMFLAESTTTSDMQARFLRRTGPCTKISVSTLDHLIKGWNSHDTA